MIDGSHLPYDENVALTKKVCEYAHSRKDYVSVEGELGVLAGVEDDVSAEHSNYTQPEEVEDFVKKTGRRFPGHLDRNQPRPDQVQA